MKKVGIMTMQRVINFGSFLQAYSLKKIYERLGHNVQFVDFKKGPVLSEVKSDKSRKINIIKNFVISMKASRLYRYKKMRNNHLKVSNEYLKLTKEPNYTPSIDLLVIGSDEVFNCLQGNPNIGYSVDLFGNNQSNAKVIASYAASFGNCNVEKLKANNLDKEVASSLKNNFKCISVRDENSYNTVYELSGIKPIINVDPVFLSSFDEELKNNQIKNYDFDYIAIYAYTGRIKKDEVKKIKQFAKNNHLKIVIVGYPQYFGDKYFTGNPFQILNVMKGAKFVITDTFHGSVFSIKYNIPFATIIRKDSDEANGQGNKQKLSFLLKVFGLSNRELISFDLLNSLYSTPIDFTSVNKVIEFESNKGKEYLESLIK